MFILLVNEYQLKEFEKNTYLHMKDEKLKTFH